MAREWYGYGRWDAPFWFVGPEPGGDDPIAAASAWEQLGAGELLDCREHHLAFGYAKWHTPPYPLQVTWRRLMLLLLGFQSEDTSQEALKAYQAVVWGASAGETCLIELRSVAASNLNRDSQFRKRFREERISPIRARIAEYRPAFVVMYSEERRTYVPTWEKLVGSSFKVQTPFRIGNTMAMITPHPLAHRYTDVDWLGFATALRHTCAAEGLWPRNT